jgi:hypothetical protein
MELHFPTVQSQRRDAAEQQREFAERKSSAFAALVEHAPLFSSVAMTSAVGFTDFPSRFMSEFSRRGVMLKEMKGEEFAAIVYDAQHRPHSVNGSAAIRYSDGTEEFYWHGIHVPEFVARTPEDITVHIIEAEDNIEVRRVMIERYGIQRYMQDCGAVKLHADKTGELYRKNLGPNEEPLVFVKVKNSTPEPDGSIKDYFLRVPPNLRKARAAVAWTFGLDEKTYNPSFES